jgi:formylglycine-generating enzyme required for sulfatase activity
MPKNTDRTSNIKKLKIFSDRIDLVFIPPGEFIMGSSNGLPFSPEGPLHRVKIANCFHMSKFLVTQKQWLLIMGDNPSEFRVEENLPVDNVSWLDCKTFCKKLSSLMGYCVRLPTEAEWEYACRAGTETEYFFGNDQTALTDYGWFELNSLQRTHPVGMKKPNPWGLYDIVGNLWEWCEDDWHSDYAGAHSDGGAWLTGEDRQQRRTMRGGAWDMDAFRCRSTYRSWDWKHIATNRFGLRIVVQTE